MKQIAEFGSPPRLRIGHRGPRAPWAVVCLLLVAVGSSGIVVSAQHGEETDKDAPVVLVLPAKTATERDDLVVRVRALDPSGIGSVVLHLRGEHETDFRTLPMSHERADEYVARVPASTERGLVVAYFVEATDARGNGPRRVGDARSPYVARLDAVPVVVAETGISPRKVIAALALLLPALFGAWFLVRRKSAMVERTFWQELLEPVWEMDGTELTSGVDEICSKIHKHPGRGFIRVNKDEAYGWLGKLRGRPPEELLAEPETVEVEQQIRIAVEPAGRSPLEELSEDIFWLHLLLPVAELRGRRAEDALHALVGRPHAHPTEGTKTFDKRTLKKRLQWVKQTDADEVFDRWRKLNQVTAPDPALVDRADPATSTRGAGQRGLSLVELLAVLAFMAVIVGIGSLYLKPLEAPLQTGGEMLEGLLKQSRAKAMATTTVHRVRPVDDHSLVVESADACSSGTWIVDPRLDMDLPQDVTLSDTSWTVCFNTRGIASNNIVLTLNHPKFGTKQLEVLMGGTVRWVP